MLGSMAEEGVNGVYRIDTAGVAVDMEGRYHRMSLVNRDMKY